MFIVAMYLDVWMWTVCGLEQLLTWWRSIALTWTCCMTTTRPHFAPRLRCSCDNLICQLTSISSSLLWGVCCFSSVFDALQLWCRASLLWFSTVHLFVTEGIGTQNMLGCSGHGGLAKIHLEYWIFDTMLVLINYNSNYDAKYGKLMRKIWGISKHSSSALSHFACVLTNDSLHIGGAKELGC